MSIADEILSKATLPTSLSSREIREEIAEAIRRRSVFSARVTSADYLTRLREMLGQIAGGELSPEAAKSRLRAALRDLGYTPEGGFPDADEQVPPAEEHSLQDLMSDARLNLQLQTAQRQAAALRQKAENNTYYMRYEYPGWNYVRKYGRGTERDWAERWIKAGEAVNWEGASDYPTVALKDSPIWQALGDGEGGYNDTLGTDFPPFAFNSGMVWREVDRKTCIELELIDEDYDPETEEPDYNPSESEIVKAVEGLDPDMKAALLKEIEIE